MRDELVRPLKMDQLCRRGRRILGVSLTGILNMCDHWFTEPEAVAPLTRLAGDFTVKKPAMKFLLG